MNNNPSTLGLAAIFAGALIPAPFAFAQNAAPSSAPSTAVSAAAAVPAVAPAATSDAAGTAPALRGARGGRGAAAGAPRGAGAPAAPNPRDEQPFTRGDYKSVDPKLPSLIIAGDSTAATGDPAHRGWAALLVDYFDAKKINLINLARGGRSFRTFVHEGLWDQLLTGVKAGDIVMIQFGHNDGGDINAANGRPDLPGFGDETKDVTRADGTVETVHTVGWYLRKFIQDVRAKGATPIVMTATPYNRRWTDNKIARNPGDLSAPQLEIARQEKVPVMDHTFIIDDHLDQVGQTAALALFNGDGLHTTTLGADVNAAAFVAGAKALDLKVLVAALNDKGQAIPAYKPTTPPASTPAAASPTQAATPAATPAVAVPSAAKAPTSAP